MTVRAEVRRELERAAIGVDKVNVHLQRAGAGCVEGKRPEVDEALLGLATLLTITKANITALRDAM